MFQAIAETVIAVVLLIATLTLVWQRQRVRPRHRGFDLLLAGLVLLTLAAAGDAFEFHTLAGGGGGLARLLLGLQLFGGYLAGILCVGGGLLLWLPALVQHQQATRARLAAEQALQRSTRELTASNEALQLLTRLADRLPGSTDATAIAHEAVGVLLRHSNPPRVAFYLLEEPETLRLVAAHGFDAATVRRGATLPVTGSLTGAALRAGHVLVSDDVSSDDRLEPDVKAGLLRAGLRAVLVIPLQFRGERLGSINLVFGEPRRFSETDLDTFRSIGQAVSLALVNARHLAALTHHAYHDSLTGLPNRARLHETFEALLGDRPARDGRLALVLLDLDRFKEINDALGHQLGDELLVALGRRLRAAVASESRVCRLGGDEFAVILPDLESPADAARQAARLLELVKQPCDVSGVNLVVGASAGIAIYGDHGRDSHELLRCADVAMYQAKRTGRNVAVYDREHDRHTPERLVLIADLHRAIAEDQLELHYQPFFSLADSRLDGFEALVRWRHPRLGLLEPDRFIPLAELGDTIQSLSCWVVDRAFAQHRKWGERGARLTVACNLSVRNLLNRECPTHVRHALDRHGLDPAAVELELTETALMADPTVSLVTLRELASLGVRLVIDDFGTGYTSLSHLKRFPLHALKIDRSFVQGMMQDLQSHAIVRSTVHLARDLGLASVAEGVEDLRTLAELRELGCGRAQGFALGRPVAADGCRAYLGAGQRCGDQAAEGAPVAGA